MASLFDKIKKDVKKGIEEGIAVVKEGASVVSGKMGELTAEGKRQYKMFDLKSKIHSKMTELGGRTYDVLDSKRSPAADSKVKAVYGKIKKLEEQLCKLEGGKETKAAAPKKPAPKAKATPKKTARPAAKKTATKAAPKKTVQATVKKTAMKAAKRAPAKK
jgi:histone H1/5